MPALFPYRSRPQSRPTTRALTLLAALALPLLAGCSNWGFPGVYRINVEQGNIVTQEMVDQLKPGMTRRQVRYILGTPLIEDPFHSARWEYIYMLRNGNDTLREQRLTVYFDGDTLSNFTSSLPPSQPESETAGEQAGEQEAAEKTAVD
jgi:outer membrane protein assembly factor BamE